MTNVTHPVRVPDRAGWILPIAFGLTLGMSALLLFAIQPLFAKMVLPRLGGTPAVWSVALVFFQSVLLAGYFYAHLLVRFAGPARALLIHATLLGAGLLWLPLGIAEGFASPPQSGFSGWLIGLFAASVGVPFFAVSANAPLLQAWFAGSGHSRAADPYFLYGASNIGSFLALVSYPILVEVLFPLSLQAKLWTAGYLALLAGVIGCGVAVRGGWSRREPTPRIAVRAIPLSRTPEAGRRIRWIAWAALPSALLVAVTAHLATNIASAPFLWVTPLALFLASFVLTFQRRPLVPHRTFQLMLPVVATAALITFFRPELFGVLGGVAINLFALLVIASTWHGELVAARPAAEDLTEFYLFMSIGGVIGGAVTSLAVPVLFDSVLEFPLLLALSLLALPEARSLFGRPLGIALAAAAALVFVAAGKTTNVDFRDRSFFGVTTVRPSDDGRFRMLIHGTTLHGAEKMVDLAARQGRSGRPEPLTYYTEEGPLATALRAARERFGRPLAVGSVGLGTGSMACHSQPGDVWRFYEIDPLIVRIASDPRFFTYLSACAPGAPIITGDARLTLAAEPAGAFDVLILDAFSSDAIPAHLLTREALDQYVDKLSPGGLLLLHISNKFLELRSVVGATAREAGYAAVSLTQGRSDDQVAAMRAASEVAVIGRHAKDVDVLRPAGFKPIDEAPGTEAWTDDYSNIVAAILRKQGL